MWRDDLCHYIYLRMQALMFMYPFTQIQSNIEISLLKASKRNPDKEKLCTGTLKSMKFSFGITKKNWKKDGPTNKKGSLNEQTMT